VQYHVHRRIELPSHAIPLRLPGPLDVKSSLLEGSRRIRVTGGEGQPRAVEDDFVLGVATGTVPPDEYDAFARAAHAIDDAFLTGIAVGLEGK
jgi:hypothetical protein